MNTVRDGAKPHHSNAAPLAALVLLALLWGYNWVVMKIALRYSGPFDFAALRGAFGVVLLFGVLLALRIPLKPRQIGKTLLLGVFQTTGFLGLISWALSVGSAGKSAVLAYTMPFWVIVLGWPFLDERLRGRQWPAVGLAFLGLLLVLEIGSGSAGLLNSALSLAAGASWGVSVIIFKKIRIDSRADLLSTTAWQMLYGVVPLVAAAWLITEPPIEWNGVLVGSLVYNAVGGMAIATFLWLYILQRLPATISGLNALTVPIVGVIAAWWQLGERPSLTETLGMALILVGLGLLTFPDRGVPP
jgi:drug/metabolite transporter (DMT)-like permease